MSIFAPREIYIFKFSSVNFYSALYRQHVAQTRLNQFQCSFLQMYLEAEVYVPVWFGNREQLLCWF